METWIFLYRYAFSNGTPEAFEMEIRIGDKRGVKRDTSFRTEISREAYEQLGAYQIEEPVTGRSAFWCKFKIYSTEKQTA